MLLLIKKHTDTLVQPTKTQPQQTLEFKMNKQMNFFSFDPPINLDDEGKWLLAVTSFVTTLSVLNTTDENNSSSVIAPGHWYPENAEETVNNLNILIDLRSENELDLHINEVNKRGNILNLDGLEDKYYNPLDKSKNDFIAMLKKNKHDDLEDMVFRLELTKIEILHILDLKYIPLLTIV